MSKRVAIHRAEVTHPVLSLRTRCGKLARLTAGAQVGTWRGVTCRMCLRTRQSRRQRVKERGPLPGHRFTEDECSRGGVEARYRERITGKRDRDRYA